MRRFLLALWIAFVCRGAFHAVVAPMWDGFDEPGHLAYVAFVAEHGRPPGFQEPSFPAMYVEANRYLPSTVANGAPSFAQWRAMPARVRDAMRATEAQVTTSMPSTRYASGNYERQQGPLFYFLAAPAYLVVKRLALPKIVVAMRLFCVLLASLTVPLSVHLFDRLGGRRLILFALPFVALFPNAPFAVDRISNEALTWPLSAAIATLLVRVAQAARAKSDSPTRRRDEILLGVLVAAGVWTKLTLLPFVAACAWLVVVGAGAVPLAISGLATAILFAWNKAASGTITGLIEATEARRTTPDDVWMAMKRIGSLPVTRELVKNHLWSGGWGFVKPAGIYYALALLAFAIVMIVCLVRARQRGVRVAWREAMPLVVVLVVAVAAQAYHVLGGAIAAIKSPNFPTIGAEGWYLDAFRPLEAALIGLVLCAGVARERTRGVAAAIVAALVVVDGIGTVMLMLPHWAGFAGAAPIAEAFRGAIEAAPVRRYAALPLLLAVGWLGAATASVTAPELSAPSPSR